LADIKNFCRTRIEIPVDKLLFNLPRNGGMADNSSLLPYKNPMPVGPHI
jgi:hypothetical protein